MKVINLTPHNIAVHINGQIINFPSEGVARVSTFETEIGAVTLDSGITIPIKKTEYGKVENLPEPQQGVMYIVSMLVSQQAKRNDLITPDTFKNAIRDEHGQLVGTKCFQIF